VFGYWDAVQIVNWFHYNLTRSDYNYLLHCYLFTQLQAALFTLSAVVFAYSVWLSLKHLNGLQLFFTYELPVTVSYRELLCKSQSQSHIATDGQSISKSWYRAPFGAHDQIFICLRVTFLFPCGALSDERTGLSFVCAAGPCQRSLSRVLVPWDLRRILLSQIWDFPFRRLLRLAGSRWRYSTPPPTFSWPGIPLYSFGTDSTENTLS
jgi:hypothetical protein